MPSNIFELLRQSASKFEGSKKSKKRKNKEEKGPEMKKPKVSDEEKSFAEDPLRLGKEEREERSYEGTVENQKKGKKEKKEKKVLEESNEIGNTTDGDDVYVKQKKKKKKVIEESNEIANVDKNYATDGDDVYVKQKKKKKKKKQLLEENSFNEVTIDKNENKIEDKREKKEKRKGEAASAETDLGDKESDSNCDTEDDIPYSSNLQFSKRKRKKNKAKDKDSEALHSMIEIKEEVLSEMKDERWISNLEERDEVFVKDLLASSRHTLENFENQTTSFDLVRWVMEQNIRVHRIDIEHRKNHIFNKKKADAVVKKYGPLRFFTEEEDEELLARLRQLRDQKVITSAEDLYKDLVKPNIHKHTWRIIGYYFGQNLPNRLAFYCTERLVNLLGKLTSKSDSKSDSLESSASKTPSTDKSKRTPSSGREPWTLAEDQMLAELVLLDRFTNRFIRAEKVVEKTIDWNEICGQMSDTGRTRSVVRERWTRVIKTMLMESEQEVETVYQYRKSLLEHVIRLGVSDRRQIRWKEVAKHFHPKTSGVLNQDFWNLIRWSVADGRSFEETLELSYNKLELRCLKQKGDKQIQAKEDNKSKLLDWYRGLNFLQE